MNTLPDGRRKLRTVRPGFRQALAMLADARAGALMGCGLDRAFRVPRDLEDMIDVVEPKNPCIPVESGSRPAWCGGSAYAGPHGAGRPGAVPGARLDDGPAAVRSARTSLTSEYHLVNAKGGPPRRGRSRCVPGHPVHHHAAASASQTDSTPETGQHHNR